MYNFLDNLVTDHTLIYQFFPAGSRNLADVKLLRPRTQNTHETFVHTIAMLMHDQEPLNHKLYDSEYMDKNLSSWYADTFPGWEYFYNNNSIIRKHRNDLNLCALFDSIVLYDTQLLCHSEKNSLEVDFYEQHGFNTVYWWSHAVIARDWYRYAEIDPQLKKDNSSKLYFNIYNRAWSGSREYRLKLTDLLIQTGLCEHSNICFNPIDDNIHYKNHIFKNPAFIPRNNLEVLSNNTASSNSSATYCASDYTDTWLDVVGETLFDDQRIHLTEKTLRPIACGKPFVLAATPNSLQFLRSYGFKTFAPYLDESYDTETDPVKRLQRVVYSLKQAQNNYDNIAGPLAEIAEYNQKHFFSDNFFNIIIDEFKLNYQTALDKCEINATGKNWYNFWKTASKDPMCRLELVQTNEYRTRQQLANQLREVRGLQRSNQPVQSSPGAVSL